MNARVTADETVVQIIAKQFARFLNRVQSQETDFLGSFLIESEWERYIEDSVQVIEQLEASGFAVMPLDPTDHQVSNSDISSIGKKGGAMTPRTQRVYVRLVFNAMVEAWVAARENNLMLDIFSMALSRAADPSSRRDPLNYVDSSFRRFAKNSMDIIKELETAGFMIMPEEATPEMIASGQRATADSKDSRVQMGAEPRYLKTLFDNLVKFRPEACRPTAPQPTAY